MAQTRIHDYRGPRSSEDLNEKLVGIMLPGVYRGFHVGKDGSVSPGVLLTAEGVRIEESEAFEVDVPASDETHSRLDLVVCVHEYEKTVPAPNAEFQVVQGTPAEEPDPPEIPEHGTVLATCRMIAGGSQWSQVTQAGPSVRIINAAHQTDHAWTVIHGARGALLERWDPNLGVVKVFVVAPGTYEDGETIDWSDPVLSYGADGIVQVQEVLDQLDAHVRESIAAHQAFAISIIDFDDRYEADDVESALQEIAGDGRTAETVKGNADTIREHIVQDDTAHLASAIHVVDMGSRFAGEDVEAALQEIAGAGRTTETVKGNADGVSALESGKLDKAGGTVSGQLNLDGPVIFNAAEAENVRFDDYVEFTRWIQPCQGNSANWENGGKTWISPGGGPAQLYIPVPGIVGAELVSVDLGFANSGGSDATVGIKFLGQSIEGGIVLPTEFGSAGGTVPAGGHALFTLVAVDPAPPHDPQPFVFDTTWWLMVEIESSDLGVLFSGARCRMRRVGIA